MPISRLRVALAAGALALLAACDPAAMGAASNRVTVPVAGRSLAVVAPPGFCVDPASTSVTASGAFVMVSDCVLLGARAPEGDGEAIGAVLTASISAGGLAANGARAQSLAEIARFAGTAEGRGMLGRSGRGDRVRILDTRTRNEVLYMLIEDRGPQPIQGIEPRFWRAFLDVQGQITVLSVLGFEGAGVEPGQSLGYIQSFAESIKRANPV